MTADAVYYASSAEEQMERVMINKNAWLQLVAELKENQSEEHHNGQSDTHQNGHTADTGHNGSPLTKKNKLADSDSTHTFINITEAVEFLSGDSGAGRVPDVLSQAEHVQVLCCGSLYLVGGLISILKPDLND